MKPSALSVGHIVQGFERKSGRRLAVSRTIAIMSEVYEADHAS